MALIGAHVSAAGGVAKSIERAQSLRCEVMQIFVQSSRTWKITKLLPEDISEFKLARKKSSLQSIVAHNSYLINLSTVETKLRKASIAYFLRVAECCEDLELNGLITHPGSHGGSGEESGISHTIDSFNEILKSTRGFHCPLLIENTAGQGNSIGHRLEHLEAILHGVNEPERIEFCFDTQHAFAAGYDLRSEDLYRTFFDEWDRRIGLEKLTAFHLNDALKGLGCRVDRHENIGKGKIGKELFERLMNDEKFEKTPMCLETYPGEDEKNHRHEIRMLKKMRSTICGADAPQISARPSLD